MQHPDQRSLHAPSVWLHDGWRNDVTLRWNEAGMLTAVEPDSVPMAGIARAPGPLLPGMPNLHSHAFQRALAGLTETLGDPADSFWSWRTLMYRFAARLTPAQMQAIARYLYIEMLKAGYTSVCEFHYLHHAIDGKPYANPGEHAVRVIEAARSAGIGLTLLPVLYQYSGFGSRAPLDEQRRFLSSVDALLHMSMRLREQYAPDAALRYGAAPHSLRAVSPASLDALREGLHGDDSQAPLHIHIAEQTREVDDCRTTFGVPPVHWLLDHQPVDSRWCLVHATHMQAAEAQRLARSGAVVGLCPTTEANLGDGIFDAPTYLDAGGRWGIGSDSHASVSARAELRWFEYGQRLVTRRRNVLATAARPAVADRLYGDALDGGMLASGRPIGRLTVGRRADFIVLDAAHPDIAECGALQRLSAYVFAEHGQTPIRDVWVGGRRVVAERHHADEEAAALDYRRALTALTAEPA
ncbi:MAG: formimidoylglutamate deiminase [Janthinobacterium lividum]